MPARFQSPRRPWRGGPGPRLRIGPESCPATTPRTPRANARVDLAGPSKGRRVSCSARGGALPEACLRSPSRQPGSSARRRGATGDLNGRRTSGLRGEARDDGHADDVLVRATSRRLGRVTIVVPPRVRWARWTSPVLRRARRTPRRSRSAFTTTPWCAVPARPADDGPDVEVSAAGRRTTGSTRASISAVPRAPWRRTRLAPGADLPRPRWSRATPLIGVPMVDVGIDPLGLEATSRLRSPTARGVGCAGRRTAPGSRSVARLHDRRAGPHERRDPWTAFRRRPRRRRICKSLGRCAVPQAGPTTSPPPAAARRPWAPWRRTVAQGCSRCPVLRLAAVADDAASFDLLELVAGAAAVTARTVAVTLTDQVRAPAARQVSLKTDYPRCRSAAGTIDDDTC